jgi:hypothetical protein
MVEPYVIGIVLTVIVAIVIVIAVILLVLRYDLGGVNANLPFISGTRVRVRSLANGAYLRLTGGLIVADGGATADSGIFILDQNINNNSSGLGGYAIRIAGTPSTYWGYSCNCDRVPCQLATVNGSPDQNQVPLFNLTQQQPSTRVTGAIGNSFRFTTLFDNCFKDYYLGSLAVDLRSNYGQGQLLALPSTYPAPPLEELLFQVLPIST